MTSKYKLVPIEPTREMWAAAGDAVVALSSQYHDAISEAVYKAMLTAAPAMESVGFCEDTVLSLAERTFSTEVDEQLAEDIIQYARRLHNRYTAPQPELSKFLEKEEWNDAFAQGFNAGFNSDEKPAPDVAALTEALEEISDPIRFMQERLEEGERLNGMVAVQLAEDAEYLRGIAIAALAAHRKQVGDL